MQVGAVQRQERWLSAPLLSYQGHAAAAAQQAWQGGGAEVPEKGTVGQHYTAHQRDGSQPHEGGLTAAECSEAAAAQADHMRKQTALLIEMGVYSPLAASAPRAAWCRALAPRGSPLPRLRSVAVLRSSKPRPRAAEGLTVTLITQLSLSRMPMLEHQCRWV